jgi:hypothetical protein
MTQRGSRKLSARVPGRYEEWIEKAFCETSIWRGSRTVVVVTSRACHIFWTPIG